LIGLRPIHADHARIVSRIAQLHASEGGSNGDGRAAIARKMSIQGTSAGNPHFP
jgi:hypothetical protein